MHCKTYTASCSDRCIRSLRVSRRNSARCVLYVWNAECYKDNKTNAAKSPPPPSKLVTKKPQAAQPDCSTLSSLSHWQVLNCNIKVNWSLTTISPHTIDWRQSSISVSGLIAKPQNSKLQQVTKKQTYFAIGNRNLQFGSRNWCRNSANDSNEHGCEVSVCLSQQVTLRGWCWIKICNSEYYLISLKALQCYWRFCQQTWNDCVEW